MGSSQPEVVTTIRQTFPACNVEAFLIFARTLEAQQVRLSAPVTISYRESRGGQGEGVTFTATVAN